MHNSDQIISFLQDYLPYYEDGQKTECYWHSPAFVNNCIKNREIYSEFANGELVGVTLFTIDKEFDMIRLDCLAVHPSYRKQGMGKRLVKKVESRAKRRKITFVTLGSLKEYKAVGFYQSIGYILDGTFEDGYEFYKQVCKGSELVSVSKA